MKTAPIANIDIIFTASCNMACSYCFIHKDAASMVKNNSVIREALKDGSFAKAIIEKLKDHKDSLIQVALWGGEPTINQDLFEPFITELLDNFPNIKEVHFSTNGSQSILGFAETLYNYSKEHSRYLRLNAQFSIDGPAYLNDANRAPNATEHTWNTVKEIVLYANDHCSEMFEIVTVPKATLSQEQYTGLADGDNLFQWFKFFDDWQDNIDKIATNGKHAHHSWLAQPSFSQPSDWTLAECKKYTVLLKKMAAMDTSQFKHYEHPLFTRSMEMYIMWMTNEHHTYPIGSIGCSGGLSNYSIDYTGKLMTCHHVYDNVVMGQGAKKEFYTSTVSDSEKTDNQLLLRGYLYHDNIEFRKAQVYGLVLLMIKSGQIDKKYAEPFWFERLFLISQFEARCWCGEMADKTSNMYLSDIGSIRLYCYGALEEIVKYYEKYRDKFYEFRTGNHVSRPE